MPVTAIGEYEFEPLDKRENFHGNIVTYWHWEKHLIFCAAIALPFPPDMRFGDVIEKVFPDAYGAHPEFEKIDWGQVEWTLNGDPFTPDFEKSLEENGFDHKSMARFWTPGLDG